MRLLRCSLLLMLIDVSSAVGTLLLVVDPVGNLTHWRSNVKSPERHLEPRPLEVGLVQPEGRVRAGLLLFQFQTQRTSSPRPTLGQRLLEVGLVQPEARVRAGPLPCLF